MLLCCRPYFDETQHAYDSLMTEQLQMYMHGEHYAWCVSHMTEHESQVMCVRSGSNMHMPVTTGLASGGVALSLLPALQAIRCAVERACQQ